jgi:hypothetical protein
MDAAAAPAPWSAQWVRISPPLVDADCELVATARNIFPDVVNLLEGVLKRHKAFGNLAAPCLCGRTYWPCPDAKAALAVLQEVGHAPR